MAQHIIEQIDLLVAQPIRLMKKKVGNTAQRLDPLFRRAGADRGLEFFDDALLQDSHSFPVAPTSLPTRWMKSVWVLLALAGGLWARRRKSLLRRLLHTMHFARII